MLKKKRGQAILPEYLKIENLLIPIIISIIQFYYLGKT